MKASLKSLVARVLGWQVRRLLRKNQLKIVAISGSIGKTSTKLAIAHVLTQSFRVNYQMGNYNDIVTVPLVFFNSQLKNLFNPVFWLTQFIKNELTIIRRYPYDVVVLELGTDGPGQLAQFKRYVRADIGILTAVTPEHMEYFADLDEVAHEETSIARMSRQLVANIDLVDKKYLKEIEPAPLSYGIKNPADYQLGDIKFSGNEASFVIKQTGRPVFESTHQQISEPQLYSVAAAATAGLLLGMNPADIDTGIRTIPQVPGRMQQLPGINNSTIIDDTYNASPEATRAALDTLSRMDVPQRVALLGNMNELGKYSPQEHTNIGNYVDAKKIHLLVTLGPDANKYLAPIAEKNGVKVAKFDDPISAGHFLREQIKDGAAVLVKGSQNKVFAEEAIKQILAEPVDADKLVRQSPYWMKVKQRCFPSVKIR